VALDLSLRYLGDNYDNPHARAISMADEWLGSPDRGELGFRLDGAWRIHRYVGLRVGQDLWRALRWEDGNEAFGETYYWRNETFLRVDTYPLRWLNVGVFAAYRDNDLATTGWTYTQEDGDVAGVDYALNGTKWQVGLQSSIEPIKMLRFWLYYKLSLYNTKKLSEEDRTLQKDHYGYLRARVKPLDWLLFSLRAKYFQGELEDLGALGREEYFEGYLETQVKPYQGILLGLRGAMVHYVGKDTLGQVRDDEYYWRASVKYTF